MRSRRSSELAAAPRATGAAGRHAAVGERLELRARRRERLRAAAADLPNWPFMQEEGSQKGLPYLRITCKYGFTRLITLLSVIT